MKGRVLITVAFAFAAASPAAADPYVGYIYPAGIQTGTTNRLVIGGQNLNRIAGVHFSRGGLRVLKIEKVPEFSPPTGSQRRHLTKWLDGIAAGVRQEPPLPDGQNVDEWRSNSWWRALGSLDAGKIAIVERNLYVPQNALQATPSIRQMLLVTVAAEPDAAPGRGELCVYGPGGISAPRPFSTTAAPHVAEPLFAPPHRPAPERPPVEVGAGGAVVLDGQAMPGETDAFRLRLAGGRRYTFRTTARELQPYVGDAVPGFFNAALALRSGSGAIVARADDECRFRPDPVMEFTPAERGVYSLEIHDVLYRGRADFVYSIMVTEGAAEPSPCPQNVDGIVVRPGEVCRKEIEVEQPGRLVLDVAARRLGSPLDAVLTLRRTPDGPVLAQWDDVTNTVFVGTVPQAEYDPIGVFDFAESGRYVAEISDRTGHGGPGYFWRLDVHPPRPGFEVYSTRSTLPLARKTPLKVKFHIVRRDGFDGAVSLEFPEEARVVGGIATAGVDVVTAQLFSQKGGVSKPRPAEVFAAAEIDGCTVRVPVLPCDEYEQAFAWKHLVPAETFLLMTR